MLFSFLQQGFVSRKRRNTQVFASFNKKPGFVYLFQEKKGLFQEQEGLLVSRTASCLFQEPLKEERTGVCVFQKNRCSSVQEEEEEQVLFNN